MGIRLTGLWRQELNNGTVQLIGDIAPTMRLLIIPNHGKRSSADPDYVAMLTKVPTGDSQQPPADLLTLLSAESIP